MKLVHLKREVEGIVKHIRDQGKTIGFVPTMGALHEGHLSLVKKANATCDYVVVSIYVNPTQFNVQADLDKYPRTIERDCELLNGFCDLVFNPIQNCEVYGEKIILKDYNFEGLDTQLEGEFRPGHFKGMANVVCKLFEIVQPHIAFFGLKDYQQYLLVKKMVEVEGFNLEVKGIETIREASGLAMSSRNERLSLKGKEVASVIHYTLQFCEKYASFLTVDSLKSKAMAILEGLIEVEYLEFRDAETLVKIEEFKENQLIFLSFAGYLEEVRLIDNIRFTLTSV